MKKRLALILAVAMVMVAVQTVDVPEAAASDLTIPTGGIVSIELITSQADFSNTLSILNAGVGIANPTGTTPVTGCTLEPATGLGGLHLMSEKESQRGCRVQLDANSATAAVDPFPAGAVLQFGMCAQTDADPTCEFVWSSDPTENSDGDDHVQTTTLEPEVFQLAWEDLENLGDNDFNDLIVVVRVQQDRDGDALWDDWETSGIDTTGDGVRDFDLPALGADPDVPDIFVEMDWMDCSLAGGDCGGTHDHQPQQTALDAVVAAFAAQGVALHLEASNPIAHQNLVAGCSLGAPFDALKADPANFGPNNPRRFSHHYMIWAHRLDGVGTSGCGELPGNDFIVTLGDWNTLCIASGTNGTIDTAPGGDDFILGAFISAGPNLTCDSTATGDDRTLVANGAQPVADMDGDGVDDRSVGSIQQQAGTLLHELGHNLDLQHGGDDEDNFKPNYQSAMNYSFQFGGFAADPDGAGPLLSLVDYSGGDLVDLNEAALVEANGLGAGATAFTTHWCAGARQNWVPATGGIDWDCSGGAGGISAVNINNEGGQTVLAGYDDWANIRYSFQDTSDFEDGVHLTTIGETEPTPDIFLAFEESLAPDLVLAHTGAPDPVVSGASATYEIEVTNTGQTAADNVVITEQLGAGVTSTSCIASPGGVCGGTPDAPTISFATIEPGETVTAQVVAGIACATGDGTVIDANATAVFDDNDLDPTDNEATVSLTVSNPPPEILGLSATPDHLWPPNHKMVAVELEYTIIDNCGDTPVEVTVSSNQPIDGRRDGNTSPDWIVHGPNDVDLRAERAGGLGARVYTITVEVTDEAGSSDSAETTVIVDNPGRGPS